MKNIFLIINIALIFLLSGCFKKQSIVQKLSSTSGSLEYQGHYKAGDSYIIRSKKYQALKNVESYTAIGLASWYGKNNHGKKTANGDQFKSNFLTAAHRELPIPAVIKITNLRNNKSAILLVNDRGPFPSSKNQNKSNKAAKKSGKLYSSNILQSNTNKSNNIKLFNRIIDVSEEAAKVLDFKNSGIAKVKIEYLKEETDALLQDIKLEQRNGAYAKKTSTPIKHKKYKQSVHHKIMALNAKYNTIK